MSTIKLPAASGGGSISIKGPASSGSDTDLLDTSGNLNITGQLTCGSHLNLGDGDEIKVGAGEDLLIYHTSDQNYLKSNNGRINLRASEVRCENAAGTEVLAKFIADGACELRYNDSAKIATIDTGVNITGGIRIGGNNSANEIDDYEEGTWSLVDSAGNVSGLYAAEATYTKIGRTVICRIGHFKIPSNTESSTASIGTLPFTPTGGNGSGGGHVYNDSDMARITTSTNSTVFWFYPNGNLNAASWSAMSNKEAYGVLIIYETAA